MNKGKRIALLLALGLLALAGLCCGCANRGPEAPTLVVLLSGNDGGSQAGLDQVNRALDEYVYAALQVHVRLEMPDNYTLALEQSMYDGKQIDIAYCPTLENVRALTRDGLLLPMEDLMARYGQGITEAVDPSYYSYAHPNGAIYAVPTNRERHQIVGFEYDREIAQRCGLDMDSVQTPEDLTAVFRTLHARAPELWPVVIVPNFIRFNSTDILSDGYGVLTQESGTTVVDLYRTDAFSDFVRLLHSWNESGYMMDYGSQAGNILYYLRSGRVLGSLTVGKVGFEAQETMLAGKEIGFVPLGEVYCPTDAQERAWYAIPTTSADPERAMQLLNLLYTDPYAANLILYGIEGVHYEYVAGSDRIIRRLDAAETPYNGPRGYAYCNQYIAAIWEGYDPDVWAQTEQVTKNAAKSPAWGFQFDDSAVAEQVYRCDRVKEEYLPALYAGAGDPDTALPAFQEALREAGIEDIIAEKQRQLDAYLGAGGGT